jgi:hypothetical protein
VEQYRKKPIVIEAELFDGSAASAQAIIAWAGGYGVHLVERVHGIDPLADLAMLTLEGVMTASPGDYVIRGVQGEFYPCKADIFAQTYERVLRV